MLLPLAGFVFMAAAMLAEQAVVTDATLLPPRIEPDARLVFVATVQGSGEAFEEARLFQEEALAPGTVLSESIRVQNTGTVPFTLRLRARPTATGGARGALLWDPDLGVQTRVTRNDGSIVYRGPLGGLDSDVEGRLAIGGEASFDVALWLPEAPAQDEPGTVVAVQFFLDGLQ